MTKQNNDQQPELTLSALLMQRCANFANSEKAVEIIDKGVEALFKNIVEDAFGSYGNFGKTAKEAFKAALPGNVEKIIDLEHYNSMVVRLMRERWAASGVESDLVEKMTDMVNEFVNEEKTPKIILASDLWAAFIEDNKEKAFEDNWQRPQVVVTDDDRGFIRIGLHAEEATSSRYASNKESTSDCDVCLGFHQQFNREIGSKTPLQHDGHDLYELYTGHLEYGSVLGKKIIQAYSQFDKLVLALYYGGSLLAWDESPDDLYYPNCD